MINKSKTISVIGLGYIGLPTSAILANAGYVVSGIDLKKDVVELINDGKIHIIEPHLEESVQSAVLNGNLKAYSTLEPSDIYIICVPTPFFKDKDIPKPNLDYVLDATNNIAKYVKKGDLIILESTSPVGTTKLIKDTLATNNVDISDVYIAYCPERVLPGNIMNELIHNDRIVGGINEESSNKIADFYSTFVEGQIIQTDCNTAEMSKLTENSFRDINIAFANELSIICDKFDINVWELIKLANHHPRVNILEPGPGVGGHCIAVDPWFIVSSAPKEARLIKKAREINDLKPVWVINKVKEKLKESPSITKVACLGLSFKPNIDDLRESPAEAITLSLLDLGIDILSVEPNIKKHSHLNIVDLDYALKNADLFLIFVKHKEFLKKENLLALQKKQYIDFCGAIN